MTSTMPLVTTDQIPRYDESPLNKSADTVVQLLPISSRCKKCLSLFQNICKLLQQPTEGNNEVLEYNQFNKADCLVSLQDRQARFKAWASNIGALQADALQTSLDYRLKEARQPRERIMKVLKHLEDSLEEVSLIVRGEKLNESWQVEILCSSDSEEDSGARKPSESNLRSLAQFEQRSEIQELLSDVKGTISSLNKLSMIIRSSPGRDDYSKAAYRYSFDPKYDIGHVKEKHGAAKYSHEWLIERLGRAITWRRQYLKYRQEHHEKLSRDWDKRKQKTDPGDHKTVTNTLASTKATTFVENPAEFFREDTAIVEPPESQTSYEATAVGDSAIRNLLVPPRPKMASEGVPFEYGEPFLCPYCYTEQIVRSRNGWKRHVFRDLKPYVCTFKECDIKMFRSRHDWFAHEMQMHRREWTCQFCEHKPFLSESTFSRHLNTKHQNLIATSPMKVLVLMCEEPVDRMLPNACHLCNDWEESLIDAQTETGGVYQAQRVVLQSGTVGRFRKHLGRHMEQLALFALPKNEGEGQSENESQDNNEDEDEDDDDDEEINRDDKLGETDGTLPEREGPRTLKPAAADTRATKQQIDNNVVDAVAAIDMMGARQAARQAARNAKQLECMNQI